MSTIVYAAIAIIVLLVVIAVFSGQMKKPVGELNSKSDSLNDQAKDIASGNILTQSINIESNIINEGDYYETEKSRY